MAKLAQLTASPSVNFTVLTESYRVTLTAVHIFDEVVGECVDWP